MNSGFGGYHPIVNIMFFIGTVVFGMLFSHPICLAVSFCASFSLYIRYRGRKAVSGFFKYLLPMLFIFVALNGLFNHYGVTTLMTLPNSNNVTLESIVYGLVSGVGMINIILWFFCYNEVVTTDKFMHVFGKHFPSVALVISMSLRFVPMYREQLDEISKARKGIGEDYHSGSLTDRIKNAGKTISVLITLALENSIETSDSMRARGYGLRGRKSYSRFVFNKKDAVMVAILIIFGIFLIIGRISGQLNCIFNPYIEVANPDILGIFIIAVYSLLCFLPLILDLWEDIKWNSLKSKI